MKRRVKHKIVAKTGQWATQRTKEDAKSVPGLAQMNAAIDYAARGWRVVPLRAGGRVPLTATGIKEATTDVDVIRLWWSQWPTANLGIAASASGLLIVDIDARKGGLEAWGKLKREHKINDRTPTVLTGDGKRHLVFEAPGIKIPSRVGKLGPGVNVRTNGFCLLLPPSVHSNGKECAWDADLTPDVCDPVPFPSGLLRLMQDSDQSSPHEKDASGRASKGLLSGAPAQPAEANLALGLRFLGLLEVFIRTIFRKPPSKPPSPEFGVLRLLIIVVGLVLVVVALVAAGAPGLVPEVFKSWPFMP